MEGLARLREVEDGHRAARTRSELKKCTGQASGSLSACGTPEVDPGTTDSLGMIAGTAGTGQWPTATAREPAQSEFPMTVKDAARFLGVSPQTVYLWVERKQIPHLRVMGRNIRFLKSDLEPFRARFKQEVGNG